MNPIEDLKVMESVATPRPWLQSKRSDQVYARLPNGTVNILRTWNYGGGKAALNRALILALRNLAPELLALWEAVHEASEIGPNHPLRQFREIRVQESLDALNAKAQEVLP